MTNHHLPIDDIPVGSPIDGPIGRARLLDYPDHPKNAASLACYLVEAPLYHPLWSLYLVNVVRLGDIPGFPPAHLQYAGATHELLVVAVNPEQTPDFDHALAKAERNEGIGWLTPVNICHQFTATDEEMSAVAWLASRSVVYGQMDPESSNGPERIREGWLQAVTKTLAHLRGEEHAR